ncbi:UNVERIFIED_CONTAM: hypothetical protein PYX00_008606 [Menopon gallinae]|uniref:CBF1-interacting co-repressor CIR N-terminal domain-containing protein n=1 Tax=Menopon gallinae TaxID=328185 RepID=A0AAW2HP78_9NEOP
MNILPKKRWHVRTRENIARVRRDEAKAAEEEKQRQLRAEKAEREARTELLRKKARQQYNQEKPQEKQKSAPQDNQHVNLFYELEQDFVTDKTNPEYEKEKKEEREKYEKQIGYLTYLGQDTNEITGNVSWYNRDPEERKAVVEEVAKQAKTLEDPLRDIKKYLGTDSVQKTSPKKEASDVYVKEEKVGREYEYLYKHTKKKSKKLKKHKKKKRKRKHSSDSSESSDDERVVKKKSVSLEALRAERMKREMEERKRAEMVLQKLKGGVVKEEKVDPEIESRYNSQFNPHLAKQNFSRR